MSSLAAPRSSASGRHIMAACAVFALSFLAGCKDRTISTYRMPKETGAVVVPAGPEATPAAGPTDIRWVAPTEWKTQEQKADGMRAASYLVTGADGATADISVITFAGTGGGDLANVNRWREQVGQLPLTADELATQVVPVNSPAGPMPVVDVTGVAGAAKTPSRLLGSWFRTADRVWFFKMIGAASLVEGERARFVAFLKSTTPIFPAADAKPAPAAPVAAPAAGGGMSAPMPTGEGPSLKWAAPADWQAKPTSAMRKGSYAVGEAEVAITVFPGDVGGVLANINRWRSQVGVGPVDEAGLAAITTKLEANGLHFVATDVTGPAANSPRIVAALVPWQGRTWFFKLTGPSDAVGRAKPAFLTFLQTVSAP